MFDLNGELNLDFSKFNFKRFASKFPGFGLAVEIFEKINQLPCALLIIPIFERLFVFSSECT